MKFDAHNVENLMSVAHLFPAGKGRRGVYRLHFSNGERYVGQTVNVVTRFGSHRRRWPDIRILEFARLGRADDLDRAEQETIHNEQDRGIRIRNVTHARGDAVGASDLDPVVTVEEQNSWLANDDLVELPDVETRVADADMRKRRQAQFERLRAHPLGEFAISAARIYTQLTIPRPRATEMTFWAATAMPSTNASTAPRLLAISINKMETLVVGMDKEDPNGEPWAFMNVSASDLTRDAV